MDVHHSPSFPEAQFEDDLLLSLRSLEGVLEHVSDDPPEQHGIGEDAPYCGFGTDEDDSALGVGGDFDTSNGFAHEVDHTDFLEIRMELSLLHRDDFALLLDFVYQFFRRGREPSQILIFVGRRTEFVGEKRDAGPEIREAVHHIVEEQPLEDLSSLGVAYVVEGDDRESAFLGLDGYGRHEDIETRLSIRVLRAYPALPAVFLIGVQSLEDRADGSADAAGLRSAAASGHFMGMDAFQYLARPRAYDVHGPYFEGRKRGGVGEEDLSSVVYDEG